VPRTSTYALTNATLPYVIAVANNGYARAARDDRALARGINIIGDKVVHAAVAESLGVPAHDLAPLIAQPTSTAPAETSA
jgi:alanine dehydrogenase